MVVLPETLKLLDKTWGKHFKIQVCGLGCSSVIECLPSMHELLGSIHSTKIEKTKKKKDTGKAMTF
jgi:hypothetical protein